MKTLSDSDVHAMMAMQEARTRCRTALMELSILQVRLGVMGDELGRLLKVRRLIGGAADELTRGLKDRRVRYAERT